MLDKLDPTRRFTDRVADYIRYRPGYPDSLLDCLSQQGVLAPGREVADIGSGTGIFTALLLDRNARVFGVEPNPAMREAAETLLGSREGFVSVAAPGEQTGLGTGSVDLVTSAQAFHWLDATRARTEFERILKSGPGRGHVALIWNQPKLEGDSGLAADYEELKHRWGSDFQSFRETIRFDKSLSDFFDKTPYQKVCFDNHQWLDREGLKGRMLSSSYAPKPAHPNFEPMVRGLDEVFDRYQEGGRLRMDYVTELWLGRIK